MKNVSPNITYGEAVASATAKSRGISNVPNETQWYNMKYVALHIFEVVRLKFGGKPIKVTSFFRCLLLNQAVGGSGTSQHVCGEALDMDGDVYGSPSNKQIFDYIKDNLLFDQLICEGIVDGQIAWVHCSLKQPGNGINRKQVLFMYHSKNGKTVPSNTPGAKKVYEAYSEIRYKELVYHKAT